MQDEVSPELERLLLDLRSSRAARARRATNGAELERVNFPERRGRFLQLRRLAWASVRECPLLERSVRYGARRLAWHSSPVVIDDLDVVPVRV
jgi:hypothetical protein